MEHSNVDIKLFIDTLGCPKNFNDSEGAAGIWEQAGSSITADPEEADVIMVNTCGFINDAKRESIDHIFSMIRLAEQRAESGEKKPVLIVSGCLTQRYATDLAKEMPEVDLFLGVNEYEKLPDLVREHLEGRGEKTVAPRKEEAAEAPQKAAVPDSRVHVSEAPACFNEFSARKLPERKFTATLRIAEGCNNRCAYCVIPDIRGNYRSRPMENILEEAEQLADAGCREILLIAQDVTEYGRDLYGSLCLPQLLKKLCGIDGIRWIRLMYCYEDKITDELIRVMAEEKKICRYIDIPLQHISDSVLKDMRRRSTRASIEDTIRRLREAIPGIHIRTTFITGFPGETEEDFEELSAFAHGARFERLGVFAYSTEEGTPAGDRPDQIDEEIRTARADEIMRHQIDISREVNQAKIGMVLDVLAEDRDETGAWIGRTEFDAPEIDGTVIIDAGDDIKIQPGDMVRVRITDAFDYDLTGVLLR